MHRRLIVVAVALALLVPAVAFAAQSPLVIGDVSLDEYPRVSLQVTVPSEVVADDSATPRFTVKENGRTAEVLSAAQPESDPVDVVLVIDASGSMQGRSMEAAKEAALAFADHLEPESRLAVVAFSDRPTLVRPLSVPGTGLESVVGGLKADGETALYDALGMAAREAQRPEVRRPVVILLSDGGDTVSRRDLDSSLKLLKAASAPVLVVALPSAEADFGTLRSIAKQTGGRFSTVAGANDLTTFYTALAEELQTTWRVTYTSHRPSTNDLEVEVQVRAGDREAAGGIVVPNPLFAGGEAKGEALEPVAPANVVTLLAAVALVFVAVAAMVTAGALLVLRPRTVLDQVKYYDQMKAQGADAEDSGQYSSKVTTSILGAVDFVAGKRGMKRFVYEALERAGLPIRPTEYIAVHLLIVLGAGVLVQLTVGKLGFSLVAVAAATFLPIAWVDSRINARHNAFEEQLPDILNLMAGSLRAGWGLQQSIDLVVEQMGAPVNIEFQRAQTEVRLGRTVEEALGSIADRIQSDDFRWAVTAIGIQREVGGNLAEVLDIVAKTIRDRGALKRQIAALTAEGRLSAWVLMLLPFVLIGLISVLNPIYLSALLTTAPGLFMAFTGAALLVIGGLWLRKVVVIEV